MAKLEAHGRMIGQLDYTAVRMVYMEDGAIFVSSGTKWRLYGHCKGDPHIAFERARELLQYTLDGRPAFVEYRNALHAFAGMHRARRVNCAIEKWWRDPLCAQRASGLDLAIVEELCRLYRASEEERLSLQGKSIAFE